MNMKSDDDDVNKTTIGDWTDGDGKLPEGWKMKLHKVSSGKKNYNRIYFLSPNEQSFDNLVKALRYMVTNHYTDEDINIMANLLLEDGWERRSNGDHTGWGMWESWNLGSGSL